MGGHRASERRTRQEAAAFQVGLLEKSRRGAAGRVGVDLGFGSVNGGGGGGVGGNVWLVKACPSCGRGSGLCSWGPQCSPERRGWVTAPHCPRIPGAPLIKMIVKRFANSKAAHNGRFLPHRGASVPSGVRLEPCWPLKKGPFCSPAIWVDAASSGEPGLGPVPAAGSRPRAAQEDFVCLLGLELELPRPSDGEDTGAQGE